jgi:hypothetical protein
MLKTIERRNGIMKTLEDIITIENNYIRQCGGPLNIKEADENQNAISRCKIRAFKNKFGKCFLGKINKSANEPALKEYEQGMMVYNFDCDFAIPKYDAELENMINEYNSKPYSEELMKDIKRIQNKIEQLGGLTILWT